MIEAILGSALLALIVVVVRDQALRGPDPLPWNAGRGHTLAWALVLGPLWYALIWIWFAS